MRIRIPLRAVVVVAAASIVLTAAADNSWQLRSTVTTQDITAISAQQLTPLPSSSTAFPGVAYAAGKGGVILRFEDGDSGTLMNSGTTNDLYDMYTVDRDFAVVAGIDTVRLWQGTSWDAIRSSTDGTVYTGVWATPEKDLVLYNVINGGMFDYVCPYEPGATTQGWCRSFGPAMIAACGHSGDIKSVNQNGDIFHVNNALQDLDATYPIFSQPTMLNLTAAYIPQVDCTSGPFPPRNIYAIANYHDLWHFDGHHWTDLQVSVPIDQTLSAIDGSGPGLVVAAGYAPETGGGYHAIVWTLLNSSWSQDTSVPPATPGLLDVAVNIAADPGFLFASDFELAPLGGSGTPIPGVLSFVDVVGEQGMDLRSENLQPAAACDLAIDIQPPPTPLHPNQTISFLLQAANHSGQVCAPSAMSDVFNTTYMTSVDTTCNFASSVPAGPFMFRSANIPGLRPNATYSCVTRFQVVGGNDEGKVPYSSAIGDLDDLNPVNNKDEVKLPVQ